MRSTRSGVKNFHQHIPNSEVVLSRRPHNPDPGLLKCNDVRVLLSEKPRSSSLGRVSLIANTYHSPDPAIKKCEHAQDQVSMHADIEQHGYITLYGSIAMKTIKMRKSLCTETHRRRRNDGRI